MPSNHRQDPQKPTHIQEYQIDFVRVEEAMKRTGLKKTMLYAWMSQGCFRSRLIRGAHARRGVRVIDYRSLIEFVESFDDGFKGASTADDSADGVPP